MRRVVFLPGAVFAVLDIRNADRGDAMRLVGEGRRHLGGGRAGEVRLHQNYEISAERGAKRVRIERARGRHVEDGDVEVGGGLEGRIEERARRDDRRVAPATLEVEASGCDRTGELVRLVGEPQVDA